MKKPLFIIITTILAILTILPIAGVSCIQSESYEATIEEQQSEIARLQQQITELERRLAQQSDTVSKFQAEKEAQLSQAQELYDFATEALGEHRTARMNWGGALSLWDALVKGDIIDSSQFATLHIQNDQVKSNIEWLYAPPEAIEIKNSLLKQLDLITDYINKLVVIWGYRNKGDEEILISYYREASSSMNEISQLSTENERNLINLQLQAEKDLGLR